MKLVQTYVPLQQILSAEMNTIQKHAVGGVVGTQNNALSGGDAGAIRTEWQYDSADLANATLIELDDENDWRDRIVLSLHSIMSEANQNPGAVQDYLLDYTPVMRRGYTGLGAEDAGNSDPTAGNPPVPAANASWALQIAANLWLYARKSTGALRLYNNTGGVLRRPLLTVYGSGVLNAR